MSEVSAILALPYLQPAQAQKHVTHNEALRLLDVLVQLTVADRHLAVPPALPAEGTRHIVGAGASGPWAGRTGDIAAFLDGAWTFVAPQPGWQAVVLDEGTALTWNGSDWVAPLASLPLLGINTTADTTNRLAVASPATLLTHAGAGHQLKINKATPADTGSLMFQTGWSGRAEMGLAGSDDFAIKVSADGATWATALSVAGGDGLLTAGTGLHLPAGTAALPGLAFAGDPDTGLTRPAADQIGLTTGGVQRALLSGSALQLDVPLTGTAVQSGTDDTTSGRLLRVGAFGLGLEANGRPAPGNDANLCLITGFNYRFSTNGANCPVSNPYGGSLHVFRGIGGDAASYRIQQLFMSAANLLYHRASADSGVTWTTWRRLLHNENVLGTVTQSSGVPTGAICERGSNANGEYVRYADGTQICARTDLTLVRTATTTLATTWTWPAAFVSGATVVPTFMISANSAHRADVTLGELGACTYGNQSISSGVLGVSAIASATFAATAQLTNVRATAVGRWF